MPEGMLFVRRLIGHPKADQGDARRGKIAQVVDRITDDGDRHDRQPEPKLQGKEHGVGQDAKPGGQTAVGQPDLRIVQMLMILDEQFSQDVDHRLSGCLTQCSRRRRSMAT